MDTWEEDKKSFICRDISQLRKKMLLVLTVSIDCEYKTFRAISILSSPPVQFCHRKDGLQKISFLTCGSMRQSRPFQCLFLHTLCADSGKVCRKLPPNKLLQSKNRSHNIRHFPNVKYKNGILLL